MYISSIRPKGPYPYDAKVKSKGELIIKQMYHYSTQLFEDLFKIRELEFLVKYMAYNHKDKLLQFTGHMQKVNYEVYSKALDSWIAKFDQYLSKPSKTFSSVPIIIL